MSHRVKEISIAIMVLIFSTITFPFSHDFLEPCGIALHRCVIIQNQIHVPTDGGMSGSVGGFGVRVDRRRLLTTGGGTSDASEGLRISLITLSMSCLHQSHSRIWSHVMRVFSSGSSIRRIKSRHSKYKNETFYGMVL